MYSILILDGNYKWKFLTNLDGSQYITETLTVVQEQVKKIAKTMPLDNILVVKNCTITESMIVTENIPENENTPTENPSNIENTGE